MTWLRNRFVSAVLLLFLAAFVGYLGGAGPLSGFLTLLALLIVFYRNLRPALIAFGDFLESKTGKFLGRVTFVTIAAILLFHSSGIFPAIYRSVIAIPEFEVGSATELSGVIADVFLGGSIAFTGIVISFWQIKQQETQIAQEMNNSFALLTGSNGEYSPAMPAARAIVENAVRAATRNMRPEGLVQALADASNVGVFLPVEVENNGKAVNCEDWYRLSCTDMHTGRAVRLTTLDHRNLSNLKIQHLCLFGETLTGVRFQRSEIEYSTFIAVAFNQCNFTQAKIRALFSIPGDEVSVFHPGALNRFANPDKMPILDWLKGTGSACIFIRCDFEGAIIAEEAFQTIWRGADEATRKSLLKATRVDVNGTPIFRPEELYLWNGNKALTFHQILKMEKELEKRTSEQGIRNFREVEVPTQDEMTQLSLKTPDWVQPVNLKKVFSRKKSDSRRRRWLKGLNQWRG